MKRIGMFVFLAVLFCGSSSVAGGYNYVKPDIFKQWMESGKKTIIVDIQVPAGFENRHFKGAIETNAYPVKSDEEKKRLDKVIAQIKQSEDDVVIVCPRGGGGAKNAYDYLNDGGVEEKRLFILEKGMEGWPYPEISVAGR